MKILIPLDGSKFSEAIIDPAGNLAANSGAEVHLISVVKVSNVHSSWYELPGTNAPHSEGPAHVLDLGDIPASVDGRVAESQVAAEEGMVQQATDYLNHIAHQFFPDNRHTKAILGDDPVKEIRGYAQREGVDVVALATHGRTGIRQMVMGSVANDLLRSGEFSLFLVRPSSLH